MRLAEVVRKFGVEPLRVRRIAARANVHWSVAARDGRAFVLRRFGAGPSQMPDIAWESRLLASLTAAGLPVAAAVEDPRIIGGAVWALYPRIAGRPLAPSNADDETYRVLGRALADYHSAIEGLTPPPQRPGWRLYADCHSPPADGPDRGETIARLAAIDAGRAETFSMAARALEARKLAALLADRPRLAVHGDFSPWNLLYEGGELNGILDFEAAHLDVAAADVAFARRGSHDAVVWGYLERRSLSDVELAALDGLWTGAVLFGAWRVLAGEPENPPPDPVVLEWNWQQLQKTRPYRPPP